jgi:hypothetical protein
METSQALDAVGELVLTRADTTARLELERQIEGGHSGGIEAL